MYLGAPSQSSTDTDMSIHIVDVALLATLVKRLYHSQLYTSMQSCPPAMEHS
jgi:hypothetical protein